MKAEQLLNGTNVRMDKTTWKRVDSLARQFRIKKADLIRNALYEALPRWEADGVRLTAPDKTSKVPA